MREVLLDAAPELIAGAVYAIATAMLTVVGLEAEIWSLHRYLAGEMTMAVWFSAVGALAIYVGVFQLGAERLVPTVRDDVLG